MRKLSLNEDTKRDSSEQLVALDGNQNTSDSRNEDASLRAARFECGLAPLNKFTARGKKSGYIFGGQDQKYGDWPSFARIILFYRDGAPSCSGVLIGRRHAITAGHCLLYGQQVADHRGLGVVVGEHHIFDGADDTLNTNFKQVGVEHICIPEVKGGRDYKGGIDYAVLRLNEDIQFDDYKQPACLPEPSRQVDLYDKCFSVGVGFNKKVDGVFYLPRIVQMVQVKNTSCAGWNLQNDPATLCFDKKTDDKKKHTCSGDSGGPVLCLSKDKRWTLVATLYGGERDCLTPPGVYENIRYLLPEIKKRCQIE